MFDEANLFTHTRCWVFILREKQAPDVMRISFALTAKEMLQYTPQVDLVYYRQFNQIAEAMGHKLLLENLSLDSIVSCILHMNPEMNDLTEEFTMR